MSKQKKHTLSLDQDYEYEMIGICSHHNDYRLVWGINKSLSVNLFKSTEDFSISNKKGTANLAFSIYEFKDEESLHEFYLVKNKNLGKFLIPEKPMVDYFLFIYGVNSIECEKIINKLKEVNSVLAVFSFDPIEFESTENLVFK